MLIIEKGKIKCDKIFFSFNSLKIIAEIIDNDRLCQLVVYLKNDSHKFYNVFFKELELSDNQYIAQTKWIEHPPFKYYSRYLNCLNEDNQSYSLDNFWNKLINGFYDEKNKTSISIKNHELIKSETECKYFFYLKRLNNKNMSNQMKDKILKTYGNNYLAWLNDNKLTCAFTNDISKAKKLKIAIKTFKK